MADFMSFSEFNDRLQSAKAEHHFQSLQALQLSVRSGPAAAAAAPVPKKATFESEFDKMMTYLKGYYDGMTCDHTYMDANGHFVDCVPVEQQPTVRAAAKAGLTLTAKELSADNVPPLPPREVKHKNTVLGTPIVAPLRKGLFDPFGNRVHCPDGCVPLPRITPSQMARCGTFNKFFSRVLSPVGAAPAKAKAAKGTKSARGTKAAKAALAALAARPVPPAAGNDQHRHAICESLDGPAYFGCATWLNVWKRDPNPGVFTLSQLWMFGSTAANGNPTTVESGWMVYPDMVNAAGRKLGRNPVIFVFYNPDGYVDGGANGYVNGPTGTGFVQFGGTAYPIMSALPDVSELDGEQRGIQMTWVFQNGSNPPGTRGWHLYIGKDYDDASKNPIGYFPAAFYGGALATHATGVQYGGEVASFGSQFGPMGSGVPPLANGADNFGKVAFQADVSTQTVAGGNLFVSQLGPVQTTPSQYRMTIPPEPEFSGYFFFGGAAG